ncbi:hypothetical protein BpHYR1_032175 [Brachionus plicatilis]|uniref:Secreted protein n=1 Tax=Brachionus plicatilis TaxID=10195 RepID=A0A3M7QQC7_BRAPC|nr:hypothetical protein BpHYR1_032175 [Brachionus plicatilis]
MAPNLLFFKSWHLFYCLFLESQQHPYTSVLDRRLFRWIRRSRDRNLLGFSLADLIVYRDFCSLSDRRATISIVDPIGERKT